MSREIKFRVWYRDHDFQTETYKMVYSDNCSKDSLFYEFFERFCHDEDKAMQYTGLKDKNSREIYEGDILEWSDYQGWEDGRTFYGIFVVEWSEDKLRYVLHEPFNNEYLDLDDTDFDHILGNIYENPNLLPHEEDDLPPVQFL